MIVSRGDRRSRKEVGGGGGGVYSREDKTVAGTAKTSNSIKPCLEPSISQPVYETKETLIRFDPHQAGTESRCVTQRFASDDRLIAELAFCNNGMIFHC